MYACMHACMHACKNWLHFESVLDANLLLLPTNTTKQSHQDLNTYQLSHFTFQEHLNECPFVDIKCTKSCGEEMQRKDLKEHLEKACPNRTKPCKYCKEEIKWDILEVCVDCGHSSQAVFVGPWFPQSSDFN